MARLLKDLFLGFQNHFFKAYTRKPLNESLTITPLMMSLAGESGYHWFFETVQEHSQEHVSFNKTKKLQRSYEATEGQILILYGNSIEFRVRYFY